MVDRPPRRLALLSIHPEYAEALVSGHKTVEFRKRALAADVTHVAIYATMPVGRIVGVFSVKDQVIDTPHALWSKFRAVAGISQDKFVAYYEGHATGVGIQVDEMVRLQNWITLEDAFGISRPPQSIQYFRPEDAAPGLSLALG
jgi:predicted transcriptional regulator